MNDEYAKLLDHQATLTRQLRLFLYRRIGLPHLKRVIDIGSGTGIITSEIAERGGDVLGVDLDPEAVALAKSRNDQIKFQQIKPGPLPFADNCFDLAFCHFLMLWQKNPGSMVKEMARITAPGGWVVIAAEPDYGGRIAYPDDGLTAPLIEGLHAEGADPLAGRKLRALFKEAGLKGDVGVWPSMVESPCDETDFAAEWQLYRFGLAGRMNDLELDQAEEAAATANEKGTRLVFTPIFYGVARK